jgi:hypothetical protein
MGVCSIPTIRIPYIEIELGICLLLHIGYFKIIPVYAESCIQSVFQSFSQVIHVVVSWLVGIKI